MELTVMDQEWIQKIESGSLGGYKVASKIPEEYRTLPVLIAAAKKSPSTTIAFAGEHASNPALAKAVLEKSPKSLKDLKDFWSNKEIILFAFSQDATQVGAMYLEGNILIDSSTLEAIQEDLRPILQAALEKATETYRSKCAERSTYETIFTYSDFEANDLAEILQTITYFETNIEGTAPRNEHTAALEEAIRTESFDDLSDLDWDEVNVAQVAFSILTNKKKKTAHLGGSEGYNWFKLSQKLAATNRIWAAAVINKLEPNLFYGVWGGDSWSPRVLWNGSVMVRNSHRVVGLHFEGIVLLSEEDLATALEDIDRVEKDNKWSITAKNGCLFEAESSEDINLAGNNVVGILSEDALEGSQVLSYSLLEDAFDNSRAGVVIRFFKKGIVVYSTSREDDEFDFAVEQLYVYSPDMGDADLRGVCYRAMTEEDSYKSFTEQEHAFYEEALEYPYSNALEDVQDLAMDELTQERDEVYDKPLVDLLKEKFLHNTYWKVRRQFTWQQNIFSNIEDMPYTYTPISRDFLERMGREENQLVLYLNNLYIESKDDVYNLGEYHNAYDILENAGATTFDAKIELYMPAENREEEGSWVELNSSTVSDYADRLETLIDTEMEGEWEYADELIDGKCVRIFFSMDSNWLLKLRDLGCQIGEELDDLDYPAKGGMRLEVPIMGLAQNFDGGDLDSGNMHR